jgi:hypothetical protein
MPPTAFEPAFPSSGRSETHILDRAATGIGYRDQFANNNNNNNKGI